MIGLHGLRRSMMLILTRFQNESIIIGNDIKIIVLKMNEDKVQFGVKAPDDVLVSRREIDPSSEPVE
jgi:carbon storage regulator